MNESKIDLPFNSDEFKNTWNEWIEYRKERRLPKYVPTGLKKTFTMLLNISGGDERTAIQIIDKSISQGYQGLFPLKTNSNAGGNKTKLGTSAARIEAARNF